MVFDPMTVLENQYLTNVSSNSFVFGPVIELENKYLQQEKQLSEMQKEEVKQIVIKSKGNPNEIKKRIQKEFGFQFVE